jgi:hypothetical protein
MNIQKCIFMILFTVLLFQGNVFAENKASDEGELMRKMMSDMASEKSSETLPLMPKDNNWGEPNDGLVTQLIPQSEEYVIGKPMKFGLVLKNVSDSVKEYDRQEFISCCGSLMVKSIDNNDVYDKRGPYQTTGGMKKIEPNEIVTLFENRDISEEYVIIIPGKYIIQSRPVPASNVIEFEVKPGTPGQRDLLVSLLAKILPDKSWRVTAPKFRNSSAEQESILVVLGRGGLTDHIGVMLWQTKTKGAINEQRQNQAPYEYLGKNDSNYFYISIPPKALDYWPKIKEDIAKTLKLES